MLSELQVLEGKLNDAMRRIETLEQQLGELRQGAPAWRHLTARPHPWRRQLSLSDRRMTVGQLVSVVSANRLTPEAAAEDLDLPVEAVYEALAYYAQNRELIQQEAAEERRRLKELGYPLEPADLSR